MIWIHNNWRQFDLNFLEWNAWRALLVPRSIVAVLVYHLPMGQRLPTPLTKPMEFFQNNPIWIFLSFSHQLRFTSLWLGHCRAKYSRIHAHIRTVTCASYWQLFYAAFDTSSLTFHGALSSKLHRKHGAFLFVDWGKNCEKLIDVCGSCLILYILS